MGRMHRWLTHVQPRKFREAYPVSQAGAGTLLGSVRFILAKTKQRQGKDALSLEAMQKVAKWVDNPDFRYQSFQLVNIRHLLLQSEGRANEVLSREHALRMHNLHLESIVDKQAGEIRRLKAQLESLRGRKRTWGIFPRVHKNN